MIIALIYAGIDGLNLYRYIKMRSAETIGEKNNFSLQSFKTSVNVHAKIPDLKSYFRSFVNGCKMLPETYRSYRQCNNKKKHSHHACNELYYSKILTDLLMPCIYSKHNLLITHNSVK